jgi:hypothetical protein
MHDKRYRTGFKRWPPATSYPIPHTGQRTPVELILSPVVKPLVQWVRLSISVCRRQYGLSRTVCGIPGSVSPDFQGAPDRDPHIHGRQRQGSPYQNLCSIRCPIWSSPLLRTDKKRKYPDQIICPMNRPGPLCSLSQYDAVLRCRPFDRLPPCHPGIHGL